MSNPSIAGPPQYYQTYADYAVKMRRPPNFDPKALELIVEGLSIMMGTMRPDGTAAGVRELSAMMERIEALEDHIEALEDMIDELSD